MKTKALLFLISFIVSTVIMACLMISLASNKAVSGEVGVPLIEVTKGNIQFGFIWGTKQFNYGYGERDKVTFTVNSEYNSVMAVMLLIMAILVGLGIAGATGSTLLGFLNFSSTPTSEWAGPKGVIFWNTITGCFSGVTIIIFLSVFWSVIKDNENIISVADKGQEGFFYEPRSTTIGYSFYLLLTAFLLTIGNMVLTYYAHRVAVNPEFFQKISKNEKAAREEERRELEQVKKGIMY